MMIHTPFVAKIIELSDGNNVHISEYYNYYPRKGEFAKGFLCIISDSKTDDELAYSKKEHVKEVILDIKTQMKGKKK